MRLPSDLLERFDLYCFQKGVEKQDAVAALMSAALAGQIELASQKSVASQLAKPSWQALLMIDDDIGINIINHYQRWTGNDPKPADLEPLEELRKYPLDVVKVGVLLSVLRAPSRVNSLLYCVGATRQTATAGIQDLPAYLHHLERKAKRAGKGAG